MAKKVLIVDDSAFMRKILREIVAKFKVEIIEAANSIELINQYKAKRPDLVFLDIIMPGTGGDVALGELKKIDPNAKVIIVTAVGHETMIKKCEKIGILSYITKPFKEKEIAERIEAALK